MKFLPTKICDSFTSEEQICHYYELGPKDYEGYYRVIFYYKPSFAITHRFHTEASRDKFLAKLIIDPRTSNDSLQDYKCWRVGGFHYNNKELELIGKYLQENNLEYTWPNHE